MAHTHPIKAEIVLLELGPFPVLIVNRTLCLELDVGDAVLTAIVQKHVIKRHPHEYARCLPHVASVVANPLFIGGDAKNPDCIELIGRISSLGAALLVAVCVERNNMGQYEVLPYF